MNPHRIAVVGGKLQGLEALYLLRKAGMETWLADRRETVPAMGLCDRFLQLDVVREAERATELFRQTDLILPATENPEALDALVRIAETSGVPLAFDPAAFGISSSKRRSDRLMAMHHIPAPRYYPEGDPPYVAKPSAASGSEGVAYLSSRNEVSMFLKGKDPDDWVIQEFIEGPSYSMEIVGRPGAYETYAATGIHMDDVFDCKRVTTPCSMPRGMEEEIGRIARTLADHVSLEGIMDVEVIARGGRLYVLEIDARIPSQTPSAVYWSTGRNEIAETAQLFLGPWPPVQDEKTKRPPRHSSFLHLLVGNGQIRCAGEHIMTRGGILRLVKGFCRADEAITDYGPGSPLWRATFLHTADSPEAVEERVLITLESIRRLVGQPLPFVDPSPVHASGL